MTFNIVVMRCIDDISSHDLQWSKLSRGGRQERREIGVMRVGTLGGDGEREDGKWYVTGTILCH